MKIINKYLEQLRRRKIKCQKGQPMLGFTEPKSHRCNWTIMISTFKKLKEEAQEKGLSISTLIDFILIERYKLFHLVVIDGVDQGTKEKS